MGCGASSHHANDSAFSDLTAMGPIMKSPVELPFNQSFSSHKTNLQHLANLKVMDTRRPHMASVIATIGPATNTPEMIAELRRAGVSIIRINMSHGTTEFHRSILDNLKQSFNIFNDCPVAVALDLRGPEVRLGSFSFPSSNPDPHPDASGSKSSSSSEIDSNIANYIDIIAGQTLTLVTDLSRKFSGDSETVWVSCSSLPGAVKPGSTIFIDDGTLSLKIERSDAKLGVIHTKVVNSGRLYGNKGVIVSGIKLQLPALSDQDRTDVQFAVDNEVDMVFASFLKSADDVKLYRKTIAATRVNPPSTFSSLSPSSSSSSAANSANSNPNSIKIIAKIDSIEALTAFPDILQESDGVLIARGDLGLVMPLSKAFLAQKMISARCNLAGKPVICATQMLQSMVNNPRPTRAEVSDVANAILDGADCVMLSSETSIGKFPLESVSIMRDITIEADGALWHDRFFKELTLLQSKPSFTESVAISSVTASTQQNIAAIICLTTTGESCKWLSKYRPRCPIIGVTRSLPTARQMQLYRNVFPCVSTHQPPEKFSSDREWQMDVNSRVHFAIDWAVQQGLLHAGKMQNVIVIQGWTRGQGHTNSLRIVATDGVLRNGKAFQE